MKYGNRKVEYDGHKFDSKAECERYKTLSYMESLGVIRNLELQPVFEIAPPVVINGRKRPPLKYRADFSYYDTGKECQIVEDVKGMLTKEYRLKRHLMKAVHNIDILETK
jgi:hypothetical protein